MLQNSVRAHKLTHILYTHRATTINTQARRSSQLKLPNKEPCKGPPGSVKDFQGTTNQGSWVGGEWRRAGTLQGGAFATARMDWRTHYDADAQNKVRMAALNRM